MKISNLVSSALLVASAMAKKGHHDAGHKDHHQVAAVYNMADKPSNNVPQVPEEDAYIYMVDRYGFASDVMLSSVKDVDELIEFLDSQHPLRNNLDSTHAPGKMVITVDGVEHPDQFLEGRSPSFMVKGSVKKLTHDLFKKISREEQADLIKLTPEMTLVDQHKHSMNNFVDHFRHFDQMMHKIWTSYKPKFGKEIAKDSDRDTYFDPKMRLINDRFFIAELSQLLHLQKYQHITSASFISVHLNSLVSIGKKTGFDSKTYEFATKVLSDFLVQLSKDHDITLMVRSSNRKVPMSHAMNKRGQELDEIFSFNDLSKKSAGSVCFTSEESCQVSTQNCASHGKCTKVGNGCWGCLCSPSFNKTTQKTTKWAGADCSKQDVSAQANLFLWTSLGLLVLLVGGIQLLYSVGYEALPGVLDAATSAKKNP